MAILTAGSTQLFLDTRVFEPAIRGWNRLEGRPRAVEFDRSLRAEVRDPLWFLTRQWQFGEFQGEDAGSPIDARLAYATTKLVHYLPRSGDRLDFPQNQPLEAVVEREQAPSDLATHRQIMRAMRLALDAEGLPPPTRQVVMAAYRTPYPLDAARLGGALDGETRRQLLFEGPHLFDGLSLLDDIPAGHDGKVDGFGLSPADAEAVKRAARIVQTWFAGLYSLPDAATPSTWSDPQVEYQFACETAPLDDTAETLLAPSYAQGHLDWYAFDLGAAAGNDGDSPAGAERKALSFIPAAISYAGIPNPRYWQFEDRHVEFADITAATTDVAKLLLMEFALSASNDWCVIPLELAVNSLCRIEGLVVTDVFGERTLVRAAGRGPDSVWQRWSMFDLSQAAAGRDTRTALLVPPTTPTAMRPPPIEKIVLLRDEMANMAWAVERIVPSAAGPGIDGYAYADAIAVSLPPEPDPAPGAEVRYRLGADVAWNWHPFIPVHIPGNNRSVSLQRARLPHERPPQPSRPIVGQIIAGPTPFFLNEEEVPRAGRIVTREFRRARWTDGSVVLWIGRRTSPGRGEGSSGLVFDDLRPIRKSNS
ncbi:MAG: hypothetical protein ACJ8FD_24915 [Bradyrhizobium canariense]